MTSAVMEKSPIHRGSALRASAWRRPRELPPVTTAVAHPCDQVSLEGAVEAARLRLDRADPGRASRAHPRRRPQRRTWTSRHSTLVDVRAQPRLRRQSRRAGARGRGRGADEGQPAHRRADGRGGRARHRHPHGAPDQPLLRHGRARPHGPADHHRRRRQHRADLDGQGRHRAERDRSGAGAAASTRCGSRSCRRWRRSTRRCRRRSRRRRLCKMADRGQITGGILDGPLALDNAISPEAAAIKQIVSPVAGRANVLVVPDLEAGNMLAKSLSFLAGADAAGIVLGRQGADHPDQPGRLGRHPPRLLRRRQPAGRRAAPERQPRQSDEVRSHAISTGPRRAAAGAERAQRADCRRRQRPLDRLGMRPGDASRRRRDRDDLSERQGAAACRAVGARGRGGAAAAARGARRRPGRCAVRGDRAEMGTARHSGAFDRFRAARGAGGTGHRLSARRVPDRDGHILLVVPRSGAPRRETDDRRRDDAHDELSRRQRGRRELRDHGAGQGGARIGGALCGRRTRAARHPRACGQPRPAGDPRRLRHSRFRRADEPGRGPRAGAPSGHDRGSRRRLRVSGLPLRRGDDRRDAVHRRRLSHSLDKEPCRAERFCRTADRRHQRRARRR